MDRIVNVSTKRVESREAGAADGVANAKTRAALATALAKGTNTRRSQSLRGRVRVEP
jgi:hypothetical protein